MLYACGGKALYPRVEVYHDVIPHLAGVSMTEFFMNREKCAEAWRIANAHLHDYFGDLFPMRKPSPAPLSYGHLICLGAPVNIPEDGEPNITPFAGSIDEGIDVLKARKGMDFMQNEFYQHYLSVWQYLREQFPGQDIPFGGFSAQGPVTSAVLMRGRDFYYDLYDEPEKSREFLELLADSISDFNKLTRRINGVPEIQPSGYVADDFASLISPDMWPDYVIPAINRLYETSTNGERRFLHLENLTHKHLPYLKEMKITHFQPSVSDQLTLENVKENLSPGIEFDWLLYSYHLTDMSDEKIQFWVDRTVQAGVSIIRTQFEAYACQSGKLDRIKAFFAAFDRYVQAP